MSVVLIHLLVLTGELISVHLHTVLYVATVVALSANPYQCITLIFSPFGGNTESKRLKLLQYNIAKSLAIQHCKHYSDAANAPQQ